MGHFHLDLVVITQPHVVSVQTGCLGNGFLQRQNEYFSLQLTDDADHRIVLDNPPLVDDRDIPAQALGLLQDRRAGRADADDGLAHALGRDVLADELAERVGNARNWASQHNRRDNMYRFDNP